MRERGGVCPDTGARWAHVHESLAEEPREGEGFLLNCGVQLNEDGTFGAGDLSFVTLTKLEENLLSSACIYVTSHRTRVRRIHARLGLENVDPRLVSRDSRVDELSVTATGGRGARYWPAETLDQVCLYGRDIPREDHLQDFLLDQYRCATLRKEQVMSRTLPDGLRCSAESSSALPALARYCGPIIGVRGECTGY